MRIVTVIGARPQFIKAGPVSRELREHHSKVLVHTGQQTGTMLAGIEDELLSERPDWVLVYRDTNSTLAGALAAAKLHIKVAHVEAGLRSFNHAMPSNINRVLTRTVSHLLFCPIQIAVSNLAAKWPLPTAHRTA